MKEYKKTDIPEIVIRILIVLAFAAATVLCAVFFVLTNNKTFKRNISRQATDRIISGITASAETLSEDGEDSEFSEVNELLGEMTESDRNRIADIIENHMSADTLSEMAKAFSEGDEEKLERFAKKNLTPKETHDLIKIAEKYGLIE